MSRIDKLPGKTSDSVKRRSVTRQSGFKSHPDATGGEIKKEQIPSIKLSPNETIEIIFKIPPFKAGEIVGFGGWFHADNNIDIQFETEQFRKINLVHFGNEWSKFGSMMIAQFNFNIGINVSIKIRSSTNNTVAFYGLDCGIIHHKHLDWAKIYNPKLLENMYKFSPEANFYITHGEIINPVKPDANAFDIFLKSCNRCARFLPININNERNHLSFSNHCVAEHRRPCSHGGFGKLKNIDTKKIVQLEYGYQLECRFCKKFEVNAAHNPQRTASQMKEDGARRRAIEILLKELFQGESHLNFRERSGIELTDYIWDKFGGLCFNCNKKIETKKKMHLDHTRPLALLWPLDKTATCLCSICNQSKRDRVPKEFYSLIKLRELSKITNIPYEELINPTPNMRAISLLHDRLDWFFSVYCGKPELTKTRDGKKASALLIKAIQKTLNKCKGGAPYNIIELYESRTKE